MSGARRIAVCCALAACAAVLLYAPTVAFDFAYDDAAMVVGHPQVTGESWASILTSAYHVGSYVRIQSGLYRPLTVASLAANHAVSGLNPWSYHLVNVALHALASALAALLALELGLPPLAAAVGALAFAVHPVHVEAVANVSGRAEILSTSLGVAGLVLYLRRRFLAASLFLGAALFAKENLVTLLGVVVLFELLRLDPHSRRPVRPLLVAGLPVLVYLAARLAVLGSLGLTPGAVTPVENPVVALSAWPRAATVLAVFGRAASLLLTPIRLSPDYGYAEIVPRTTLLDPGSMIGAVLLIAMITGIALTWRRSPLTAFFLGSIVLTYSIVSNAFVIIGTVLGDRLLYLPSVFACLLLGSAASWAAGHVGVRTALVGAGIVLLALSARAAGYVTIWRNDATLFAYAARVAPQSVRALGGWGEVLAEGGRLAEARAVLDRAVTIAPDFITNRLNRGGVALMSGDLDTARADAERVLAIEPGNKEAAHLMAGVARARPESSP